MKEKEKQKQKWLPVLITLAVGVVLVCLLFMDYLSIAHHVPPPPK